jgi:quercetin dioxygenase-like cupin family protein
MLKEAVYYRESDRPFVNKGIRGGEIEQHYDAFFEAERGIGVRVGSARMEPTFTTPRHRHGYDQIRFVVDGELRYGKTGRYGPGDCLYLPEAVYYGPQRDQNVKFVDMQFTGPAGLPYFDQDALIEARKELAKSGSFANGMYTDATGHTKDAYHVITEHLTGQPVTFPEARYSDYVVMRSKNFPWIDSAALPGVQTKRLGAFNETGPYIQLARLQPGAALPRTSAPYQEARFITDGAVTYQGQDYPAISFAYIPPDTTVAETIAATTTTVLLVRWAYKNGPNPTHWAI